jgi:hypothetical protein
MKTSEILTVEQAARAPQAPRAVAPRAGLEPAAYCLGGRRASALCRPADSQVIGERKRERQWLPGRSSRTLAIWPRGGLARRQQTHSGLRTLDGMSVQREELLRLVEELPEYEVPAVLDDIRRHLRAVRGEAWPPEWFGAGESQSTDVAARSEDLLDEGFGRSA